MSIIRNLICLENNRASVIRFKSGKMEFLKRDGEIDFPINVDFWEWWKRVVSYINDDPVDICFVYDKKYDVLNENEILLNNVINSEQSEWKAEHIKSFFWELRPMYVNLLLVGPNKQEVSLGGSKNISSRIFCTNLNFNPEDIRNKEENTIEKSMDEEGDIKKGEENYSDFAKYFIDLIKKERG